MRVGASKCRENRFSMARAVKAKQPESRLSLQVHRALRDADLAVPIVDASRGPGPGDRQAIDQLRKVDSRAALVVLNKVARSVVEGRRGQHETHVFAYHGKPVTRMLNSAWMRAREKADLKQVRVHDLKHTFGRRLRAAGISFEDRQDLLGHKSGRITTHYSAAELHNLIEAANSISEEKSRTDDFEQQDRLEKKTLTSRVVRGKIGRGERVGRKQNNVPMDIVPGERPVRLVSAGNPNAPGNEKGRSQNGLLKLVGAR